MSSTNRGAVRKESDFYPTPWEAFSVILPWLPKDIHFHDPAAGDGRLIRWLRESGRDAWGSDLYPHPSGVDVYPQTPVDYLKDIVSKRFVITNPPFSLAQEFCDHALKNSFEVMMLLRLNFLGSQKRKEWWKLHEPDAIFVLSDRPGFVRSCLCGVCKHRWSLLLEVPRPKSCPKCFSQLVKSGSSDSCEYGWFYWGDRFFGIKHP